jgi:hypothetical protein
MTSHRDDRPVWTYASLDAAYDHFNLMLFGSSLPPCLITMQRHKGLLVADGQETSLSPVPRQIQRILRASATSAEVKPRLGTRRFWEDSGL